MPNTIRHQEVEVTRKRTVRNTRIVSPKDNHQAVRGSQRADRDEAGLRLKRAIVAIDKAVTKGVLHKNVAA